MGIGRCVPQDDNPDLSHSRRYREGLLSCCEHNPRDELLVATGQLGLGEPLEGEAARHGGRRMPLRESGTILYELH